MSLVSLIGRGCIATIFLISGTGKIFAWDQTTAYMTHHGMVAVDVFLFLAASTEIFAGIFLFLGLKMRFAALILALYLVPVTNVFHAFWTITDQAEHMVEYYNFLKNLAIFGGLLCIAATPKSNSLEKK